MYAPRRVALHPVLADAYKLIVVTEKKDFHFKKNISNAVLMC